MCVVIGNSGERVCVVIGHYLFKKAQKSGERVCVVIGHAPWKILHLYIKFGAI